MASFFLLVLRFSAAPKGPKQESPGQRPGDPIRMRIRPALKGRNKILDHKPVLPLQGVAILNTRSNSQGGALGCNVAAPTGRDSRSATSKLRKGGKVDGVWSFFPPCEQRFFRPCFLAFQMACIYQLSFANGIATDRVSNQIWRFSI